MNGIQITTDGSPEGIAFLVGMENARKHYERSAKMFFEFVKNCVAFNFLTSITITAWHSHDGWLRKDLDSVRNVIDADSLTWIGDQIGCHSSLMPSIGDYIAIVADTPNLDKARPFKVYLFKVISKEYRVFCTFKLEYVTQFYAHVNKYQQYDVFKPSKWWLYWNKKHTN
jgi:hypothetical protein